LLIDRGVKAFARTTDVSDRDSVRSLASFVDGEFGKIDILVNNAAYEGVPTLRPVAELEEEAYDRTMAVNAKGPWLMAQAFLPLFRKAGGGVIVNQGSIGAFLASSGILPYTASKNALTGITKGLARELGPLGIRVNTIAPGAVASESLLASSSPELVQQAIASQCLNIAQKPEDLVGPLLFLCSDASRFITGQTIVIDGGIVMLP
jgi:NAD(P)-dependent dehydrogenase (short-subunit alcohol dehydrogenase family)